MISTPCAGRDHRIHERLGRVELVAATGRHRPRGRRRRSIANQSTKSAVGLVVQSPRSIARQAGGSARAAVEARADALDAARVADCRARRPRRRAWRFSALAQRQRAAPRSRPAPRPSSSAASSRPGSSGRDVAFHAEARPRRARARAPAGARSARNSSAGPDQPCRRRRRVGQPSAGQGGGGAAGGAAASARPASSPSSRSSAALAGRARGAAPRPRRRRASAAARRPRRRVRCAPKGAVGGVEQVMALVEHVAQRRVSPSSSAAASPPGSSPARGWRSRCRPAGAADGLLDEALAVVLAGRSRCTRRAGRPGRRDAAAARGRSSSQAGQVAADHVAVAAWPAPSAPAGRGRQRSPAPSRCGIDRLLEVQQAEIVLAALADHRPGGASRPVGMQPVELAVDLALQVAGVGRDPDRRAVLLGPQAAGAT